MLFSGILTFCFLHIISTSASSASFSNQGASFENDESVRNMLKDFESFVNTTATYNTTESVLEDILSIMKRLSDSQNLIRRDKEKETEGQQATKYENMNGTASNEFPIPQGSVIYGSPICVYQCVILQVYWADSSVSILGFELPQIPTFPQPSPA